MARLITPLSETGPAPNVTTISRGRALVYGRRQVAVTPAAGSKIRWQAGMSKEISSVRSYVGLHLRSPLLLGREPREK